MSNKESFKDIVIHLYAIAEGTGHIQRIYNIYDYLNPIYKNIEILIWDLKGNLSNTITLSKSKVFRSWKELNFPHLEDNKFIIIADIRDHNPEIFIKLYKKFKIKILCLDNHFRIKQPEIENWITLPYVDAKDSLTEILKNHFWNKEFIEVFLEFETQNIDNNVLIYSGILDHTYNAILKDEENIKTILKAFDLSYEKMDLIDKKNYSTRWDFYQKFKHSNTIITYPGLLFYEAMFLGKKIIAYDLGSVVHRKILGLIKHQYSMYYKGNIKINSYEFFCFDFKNFREKELKDVNLWTSYKKLKNWIEKNQ